MNKLTTDQMEEQIRNVKEYMSKFFSHEEHKDYVIIMGAGDFHHQLADRS